MTDPLTLLQGLKDLIIAITKSFGIFIQESKTLFIMSDATPTIHPGERLFLLIFEPLINNVCLLLPFILLLCPFYYFDLLSDHAFAKIAAFLGLITYLNKDMAGGRSIGKRFLGYAVVNERTEQAPRKAICFLRNLTVFIYPAEIVFGLFSPHRKLSDYFTHTKIIKAPKENRLFVSFYHDLKNIPYDNETREVLGLTVLVLLIVLLLN